MVRKNITGARYGVGGWLQQRVTAFIMLIIGLALCVVIASIALVVNSSIASWQLFFHLTAVRIVVTLFFIALAIHAWVGMRDIWIDYIHCQWLRLSLVTCTLCWLVANVLYAMLVIW